MSDSKGVLEAVEKMLSENYVDLFEASMDFTGGDLTVEVGGDLLDARIVSAKGSSLVLEVQDGDTVHRVSAVVKLHLKHESRRGHLPESKFRSLIR